MSLPLYQPPERVQPVARLLAVLGEPEALSRRSREVEDWAGFVATAFDQGVGGLLVTALSDAGFELPTAVAAAAEEVLLRDRLWSRKVLADLAAVQEGFDRARVRVVVLKGPVLAERVYPQPELRPAGDLDLLVTPAAFDAAAEVLRELGYEGVTASADERRQRHALGFESSNRVRVELHRRASSKFATLLESEPLVERSIACRMHGGLETRRLEPADELLYLAVHLARHRFARLRWLWELGVLIDRCDAAESDRLVERARQARVGHAVAVALGVLERRLDHASAGEVARRLAKGVRFRAGRRIAGWAADPRYRQRGLVRKSQFVLCEHTYRALLAETPALAIAHWARTMRRSMGNLWVRAYSGESRGGGDGHERVAEVGERGAAEVRE